PDETLAMSYLYLNKYLRFHRQSGLFDSLDPYVCPPFPPRDPIKTSTLTIPPSTIQTLALATLSLASKSTESPRRLSSILLPAHALLHPRTPRLRIPSPEYDTLRATIVAAELVLLRILGFETRLSCPMDYLQRYLERVMEGVETVGEDYERWGKEAREEYGVVVGGVLESRMGRMCKSRVVEACKDYQLANLFPARAIAVAVVYAVMEDRGLRMASETYEWVKDVSSSKVDFEDFMEASNLLRNPCEKKPSSLEERSSQ
ncbi:MAG: hypothetical protein Q9183_002323, partial [Haloplaca sp. 2 TL-2023]